MIDENYAFAELQICLRPRVTLTFDLLTPKVDRLMPLLCGPFVPVCTRIGSFSFYRAMLCKRGMCHHAMSVCVCVCLSVVFVHSVKTSTHILRLLSPAGSHTILAFPHQISWQYPDAKLPNRVIECKGV